MFFFLLGCIFQVFSKSTCHCPSQRAACPHYPARRPPHYTPCVWSPWSFFFWDRPVLRVLDQEKKTPFRFFSLSSSPGASFSDRPDLDFPVNCHQQKMVLNHMKLL